VSNRTSEGKDPVSSRRAPRWIRQRTRTRMRCCWRCLLLRGFHDASMKLWLHTDSRRYWFRPALISIPSCKACATPMAPMVFIKQISRLHLERHTTSQVWFAIRFVPAYKARDPTVCGLRPAHLCVACLAACPLLTAFASHDFRPLSHGESRRLVFAQRRCSRLLHVRSYRIKSSNSKIQRSNDVGCGKRVLPR